ncbi:hypothetical protein [Aquimarina spongiae]|uniref:Uncharacterized protein n=1 Tax=Aquimarina spongiae TaxID=570521 RepID=A0A1M6GP00_9FLAO|nr:hypothetical protein [Aquimarina spongiae]SHJ11586.1 hypothetical protein SAMN04488508_105371 [Aquimarina spongiae]
MAKIKQVTIDRIPEYVEVDDQKVNNIIVNTEIEFHPLDVIGNMEYILHLFVFDIHGTKDVPVLLSNWDDSKMLRIECDKRKDDFLCKETILLRSEEVQKKNTTIKTPMALKLGKLQDNTSVYSRQFKVFATIIPAIDRASKWSESFESQLVFTA